MVFVVMFYFYIYYLFIYLFKEKNFLSLLVFFFVYPKFLQIFLISFMIYLYLCCVKIKTENKFILFKLLVMYKDQFILNYARECLLFNCSSEVALFIASQFALESNFGRSDIALENRNICGMKLPKIRVTTALKENRGHAVYSGTRFCLIDYFLWLSYFDFKQCDLFDLALFKRHLLESNYCSRHGYIESIESLYDTYIDLLTKLKSFKDGKSK